MIICAYFKGKYDNSYKLTLQYTSWVKVILVAHTFGIKNILGAYMILLSYLRGKYMAINPLNYNKKVKKMD